MLLYSNKSELKNLNCRLSIIFVVLSKVYQKHKEINLPQSCRTQMFVRSGIKSKYVLYEIKQKLVMLHYLKYYKRQKITFQKQQFS